MSARRLLLVGAGHAHLLLLRRWVDAPIDADVTVVTGRDRSTYSGMVPGVIAGDYRTGEAQIPVVPLARRAGAAVVIETVRRVDPERRIVELRSGAELPYDLASLDVGSGVRGLDVPGVREHALATRPIDDLAERLDDRIRDLDGRSARVVVVGGGAAGVEISFVMKARLSAQGISSDVTLACGSDGLLPGYGARVRRMVTREAASHGVSIDSSADVDRVDAEGAVLDGRRIAAEVVIWSTGPAAPELIPQSPLPRDENGFVRVASTLAVRGCRDLFAVGDCATIEGAEWIPKAGVHAVREAPTLEKNLRAALTGEAPGHYRPQRSFLSLLNLGGGRALATKWGFAVCGRWPWLVKDRIDRGFVRQLQQPDSDQRR